MSDAARAPAPGKALVGRSQLEAIVAGLSGDVAVSLTEAFMPRTPQKPPSGTDWTTWLILAGRGFGKTATGAAWINELALAYPGCRIALVAATAADARGVMVEGEAGLIACNPLIKFWPARRQLEWIGGSIATLYSAAESEQVRGPSFDFAWGDEAAQWDRAETVVANLRMALRLGDCPRLLLTTTPRPVLWLKALAVAPGVVTTRGRTQDNSGNLPAPYIDGLTRDYAGTQRGRQELDGEFVDAVEGALWSREGLEACRIGTAPACVRIVVAVDPPAGAGARSNACGIVVAGLTVTGGAVVLADRSIQGLQPEGWARAVVAAADAFDADLVIAEVNNGGTMVTANLRSVDSNLNVKAVHASAGKVARAEPVASLYAAGKVAHVGVFPELEDEMCALGAGGAWDGPGSPDRADALVWALTELMLGKRRAEPGVRLL